VSPEAPKSAEDVDTKEVETSISTPLRVDEPLVVTVDPDLPDHVVARVKALVESWDEQSPLILPAGVTVERLALEAREVSCQKSEGGDEKPDLLAQVLGELARHHAVEEAKFSEICSLLEKLCEHCCVVDDEPKAAPAPEVKAPEPAKSQDWSLVLAKLESLAQGQKKLGDRVYSLTGKKV
jgi:hypothetical protein